MNFIYNIELGGGGGEGETKFGVSMFNNFALSLIVQTISLELSQVFCPRL